MPHARPRPFHNAPQTDSSCATTVFDSTLPPKPRRASASLLPHSPPSFSAGHSGCATAGSILSNCYRPRLDFVYANLSQPPIASGRAAFPLRAQRVSARPTGSASPNRLVESTNTYSTGRRHWLAAIRLLVCPTPFLPLLGSSPRGGEGELPTKRAVVFKNL